MMNSPTLIVCGDSMKSAGSALGKILGRTDQVTKVQGIFIHPWQVDEVMAKFPGIANYQLVVTRKDYRDEITIYLELREEVADRTGLKGRVDGEVKEVRQDETRYDQGNDPDDSHEDDQRARQGDQKLDDVLR